MSLSDNVATVALVVSLVALIVSGLQLLQQLFGTSEGWSRCGPLVIGDWSRLRRSRWLWTELRYETKFVTPRIIVLRSTTDLDWTTPTSEIFKRKSWYCYLFLKHATNVYQHPHAITKFWEPPYDSGAEGISSTSLARSPRVINHFKKNFAVSWPQVVHELGRYSYLQIENTILGPPISVVDGNGPEPGNKQDTYRKTEMTTLGSKAANVVLLSSFFALTLEERSWDSMPPDVVRPMATISLGHLIIVATRLGMRWRKISLFEGLQATGALGSISSTMVPGLGVIALFNFTWADLSVPGFRLLVPSKEADKLMCGIIPTDTNLGICTRDGKDVPLVDDDGSLNPMRYFFDYDIVVGDRRLPKEQVHERLMNSIETRHRPDVLEWWVRAAVFDAWCMLCPFLPIERSTISDIILPLPGEHMRTPLNYPGGRQVLCILFLARFQQRRHNNIRDEWVRTLIDGYNTLQDDFNISESEQQRRLMGASRVVERLASLRRIHENISAQLNLRMVKVLPLVGIHIHIVMNASRKALSNWDSGLDEIDQSFAIPAGLSKDLLDQDRMHLLACCYTDEIDTWKKYASERDHDLMQSLGDDGELIWWTLVLRAMVWALSVRVNLTGGTIPYEPVSSSLYGDPTPIWIM